MKLIGVNTFTIKITGTVEHSRVEDMEIEVTGIGPEGQRHKVSQILQACAVHVLQNDVKAEPVGAH